MPENSPDSSIRESGSATSVWIKLIGYLGHSVATRIWRLGFATRFMLAMLSHSGAALKGGRRDE